MSRLHFQLQARAEGSHARAGHFTTLHNRVETPVFMPVGTKATVRGQSFNELESLGFPILLANTYHLLLRPGPDVFLKMGGIQRFMGWKRSVLTDSGGFQIFSLPNDRVMSEEGALFKSYIDSRSILLTPEKSIEMQKAIGSDIMMVLDQCIPSVSDHAEAEAAMHLTHRWAKRSFLARGESPQSLFGIVQGACFPDLRKQSASILTDLPFDGFAIGGLAVGETKSLREDMTALTTELLPTNLPRYLMGVGTPLDILEAVHRGVDMFDCVLPMVLGQQGVAFTDRGKIDLRRGAYKFLEESLDPSCECTACKKHSLAYLHYMIRVKEDLGRHLIAAHNLRFYARLMKEIREHILANSFLTFYETKREAFSGSDRNFPITKPKPSRSRRPSRQLGHYEVHETSQDVFSVRHVPSGEVMHSVNHPVEEAKNLYVNQSRLLDRVRQPGSEPIVIWDVGLGAAYNAMTAIDAYQEAFKLQPTLRPLHIVSFENNLDSLKLVLRHPNLFPHVRHAAPGTLLESHCWKSKSMPIEWSLIEGDFFSMMQMAAVPDIIFFDPFSMKTDSETWAFECFKKIFSICREHDSELFTYSSSTAVRALLLASGFFVAKGAATGPRPESTVALTPKAASRVTEPHFLLPSDWLKRWERSHSKFPVSVSPENHSAFEESIRSHRQFSSLNPSA